MTELSALPVQHTLDIAPPLLPATVLRNDAEALAAAQELAALVRIAEVSLREVDHGLIEAAQAMGCRRWHIVWHVLLPEALPGIVGGFTITLVTMINSSAMAGAIGAGGLGDIAYRYGYQRFDTQVMLTVIVLLVVLVAVIQLGGDRLAVRLNKR
ncbi:D-methionine transport system permease protein [Pseudomonas abietaniphila]|uniref:D-methionine transport system permease protein n=1 Tax=Pseudomonas abietaniphila TaxID=89065 RepID=A0A1G7ZK25_9PSED|nr:D-methionine transport system permease protein [Pseudomonas abietaniphila]